MLSPNKLNACANHHSASTIHKATRFFQDTRQQVGTLVLSIAMLGTASAQDFELNAAPYMPSVGSRHALTLLADEAGLEMVITHWPQPSNAVYAALQKLNAPSKSLTPALQQARESVLAELLATQKGAITANVRNRAEGLVGFGDDYTPGSSMAIQSPVWLAGSAEGWRVTGRLAARVEDNANPMIEHPSGLGGNKTYQTRLTDSALVASLGAVNVQMFAHNTWWSPGWQSSLLASNNVPAWNAIGVQRAESGPSASPWLSWLGPWSYEWFVAQAQDPQVVASQQPTGYLYTGMRLTAKPTPWMEFAVSRMLQSNGAGQYGGLSGYLKGISGFGLNADTEAQAKVDAGNALAGFDLRLNCGPLGLRCAAYAQAMGEDAASAGIGIPIPYKYLTLGGLETWSGDGRHRWFLEYADTHCQVRGDPYTGSYPVGRSGCAYRNYSYPQGETNGTRWQGSSFGPDSAMTTIGWYDAQDKRLVKLMVGDIGTSVGSYNPSLPNPPTGNAWAISAKKTFEYKGVSWSPELAYLHLGSGQSQGNYKNSDLRIGLTATVPLFEPVRTASNGFFGTSSTSYALWPEFSDNAARVSKRVFSTDVTPGWAWAAGAVLLAHAMDKRVDNWAIDHQSGSYNKIGLMGSNTPILMAGGIGLMGLGLSDQKNAELAGVAATSAVMSLITNTALKFAVGRARPEKDLGDASFSTFNKKSLNSSFASSHTALAFAMITPYAQAYDMPWLYGLGALTALGRIQERQHWLSDTVAGGAIGYAISSALMRSRSGVRGNITNANSPEIFVSPNQVQVAWAFQ